MKDSWLNKAKEDNCKYLLIVYDLEDKDIFPIYIKDANIDNILKCIKLSINKQKIEEIINIETIEKSNK